MAIHRFERQLNGLVTLDICFPCQGIWFDEYESAQLAPAGVLDLFGLLHEHHADLRQPWPGVLRCPRCRETLLALRPKSSSAACTAPWSRMTIGERQ